MLMEKNIHRLADWLVELTAEGLRAERKVSIENVKMAQEHQATTLRETQAA